MNIFMYSLIFHEAQYRAKWVSRLFSILKIGVRELPQFDAYGQLARGKQTFSDITIYALAQSVFALAQTPLIKKQKTPEFIAQE